MIESDSNPTVDAPGNIQPERIENLDPVVLGDSRLALLIDASVDSFVVLDSDLNIKWVNPGTEKLLGIPASALIATSALELLYDSDDLNTSAVMLERMLVGIEDDPPVEVRLRNSGGEPVTVEIKGSNLSDIAGIEGIVLTARDMTPRVALENELRSSHRRFESLVRNSNDAIVLLDTDLRVLYASASLEHLTGYAPDDIIGVDASEVILEPQRTELLAAFDRVVSSPDIVESVRVRLRQNDGDGRWYEVRVSNKLADPDIAGVIANVRDVTDVVEAETEADQLTDIFELTKDLVTVVDGDSRLLYMNPACAEFMGLAKSDIPIGTLFTNPKVMPPGGHPTVFGAGERSWTTEVVLRRADGEKVPFLVQIITHSDLNGVITRYSAVAHDISEIKRLTQSLESQALHDPLTGLPNRVLLESRMRQLVGMDNQRTSVALLFIDLDHFKVINDSLGHEFGDKLLQAVAARLRSFVRPGDTVARFGGDEFVVLCEGVTGPEVADEVARRVSEVMREPMVIDGTKVHIGVSVGIALASEGVAGCDPGDLIRDADTAMYRAKADGRGRAVLFDDELRRQAVERQRIESALRVAHLDGSLELHYQPIVELTNGRLATLEALLRWRHDGRLMPPDSFIPVAEETDLIVPVGAWVIERACADVAKWKSIAGYERVRVSVNVSVRQLQSPDFVEMVADVLQRTGLSGRSLVVELTESVMVDDLEVITGPLSGLRALGVVIAIDDFGTGYSSLTYLAELPVDVVKLDRTFLSSADVNPAQKRLVAGAIQLVKTMGLCCVAEGIETGEQFRWLTQLGCDRGQGYFIAKPMANLDIVEQMNRLRHGSWDNCGDGSCGCADTAPRATHQRVGLPAVGRGLR
ncbi:MAG: EAL domain-containing protein [Microthrixaceae bacterium]